MDQVKQFILAYVSVPEKSTKELSSSLYNPLQSVASIFYTYPSTLYENFTKTTVDVPPSGAWLLIISPSGDDSSICIYSCFSSLEKKQQQCWFPLGDNHSYKNWSICPWSWKFLSIRFGSFDYLLNESFQHRSIENYLTPQFTC